MGIRQFPEMLSHFVCDYCEVSPSVDSSTVDVTNAFVHYLLVTRRRIPFALDEPLV